MSTVRGETDKVALRAFWGFYEPLAPEFSEALKESVSAMPVFTEIIRSMSAEEMQRRDAHTLQLQRAAILEGDWEPLLSDLREQGAGYASLGVSFGAWFDVLALFRDAVRARLIRDGQPVEHASLIAEGINRFLDISMATIGEAYLATKEAIIRDQQEAIREISTPVLQIQDKILILPIVGLVDTYRARQITESVLKAIRARRARAVIMDVTGVPIVDSKVAKHLAQTCEAARLMGATVIVTGISQEIAQTLVTIGADLSDVVTLGDLQSGFEEVTRIARLDGGPSGVTP